MSDADGEGVGFVGAAGSVKHDDRTHPSTLKKALALVAILALGVGLMVATVLVLDSPSDGVNGVIGIFWGCVIVVPSSLVLAR